MSSEFLSSLPSFEIGASAALTGSDIPDLPDSQKDKTAMLEGYCTGLSTFFQSKKPVIQNYTIKTELTGPTNRVSHLFEEPARLGYSYGLNRKSLSSTREEVIKSNPQSEPAKKEVEERLSDIGYQLGFYVGLLRDFDIIPKGFILPKTDKEYDAFVKGLSAEPIPFDPHTDLEEFMVNTQYCNGLTVWLHSQGLDEVHIASIRPPERLGAFKAGLACEDCPVTESESSETLEQVLDGIEKAFAIEQAYELGKLHHKD